MDDLQSRLERLARPVDDVDGALAGVHAAGRRRRVRRRGIGGAAVVAVVAVLFSAIALTGRGSDDAAVIAADPDGSVATDRGPDTAVASTVVETTIAPGTSVAPEPTATDSTLEPPGQTTSTVVGPSDGPGALHPTGAIPPDVTGQFAAPSEIEVVITPERSTVVIGERVRVRVAVINHSALPARFIGADGCSPFSVTGSGEGLGTRWLGGSWQGNTGLAEYVADNDLAPLRYPVGAGPWVSRVGPVCHAMLSATDLEAGGRIEETDVWDPIAGASWSRAASDLSMVATVRVAATSDFSSPGDPVSASTTIHVTDDARAHAPREPFITSVETNTIVQSWLSAHGYTWDVQLGFANGATELWFLGSGGGLRVRGDAATGAIVEIRSVDPSYAPGDDPDSTFKDPHEQILFSG